MTEKHGVVAVEGGWSGGETGDGELLCSGFRVLQKMKTFWRAAVQY